MPQCGLRSVIVVVLGLVLVFGFSGAAFGESWDDLTPSIMDAYGVVDSEVAEISDGYTEHSWRPYVDIPRKQFAKMATGAYHIPLVDPATPTYTDVPVSHEYYEHVEATTEAGLTGGVGDDLFAPEDTVTREEAAAIISRWVAAKNGYDLDTMYGESEIDAILGGFGDPSHVGPDLREEMAFSIDFGILRGNASGDLDAKGNLTRIQGGAMLIRSWALVPPEPEDPEEEPVVPADIELVSDGEAEHLIGLMGQNTFKVTQEDGSAAPNVLVDFDTLSDAGYVGSIWPQAALTDEEGELTVSVTSTEIGIQSISAAVPGVSAVYATKYWLALDEVYILDEGATAPEEADEEVGSEATARNDAGSDHEWEARVVVFGPGPLSTDRQDFYNTVNPDGDPADPTAEDGVSYALNDYSDELELREETGRIARTVAGVPVFWSISVDSAGEMVRAGHDPDIAEDGRSAWAYTNDGGLTDAVIDSEVAGTTTVTVSADYQGNPYEGLLLNRNLYMGTDDDHGQGENGEEQPGTEATAVKTWVDPDNTLEE